MQSWEAFVLLFAVVPVALLGRQGAGLSRRGALLMAALAALLIGLDVGLEGYRWQMLPAYLAIACSLLLQTAGPAHLPGGLRALAAGLLLLAIAGAALAAYLFPIFKLPEPTGAYQVGTTTLVISDPTRQSPGPLEGGSGVREVPVQVFYPAANGSREEKARYMPRALATRFKPQLALVQTDSRVDAPVSAARAAYPLVLYSPSWGGNRHENTALCQELASHGYIVAAMDVPGETSVTVYPDGRTLRAVDAPWLSFASKEDFARTLPIVREHLAARVADARLVLDELTKWNTSPGGRFSGRLDLSLVAIFGYSFGGTTAAEVCRIDRRFRAGVNMDGFAYSIGSSSSIPIPFFFLSDDDGGPPTRKQIAAAAPGTAIYLQMCLDEYAEALRSIQTHGGNMLTIAKSEHANFCESPLYCRLRRYSGAGEIPVSRCMLVVRTYVTGFLDKYLRSQPEPLLDGNSPRFPEAMLTTGADHSVRLDVTAAP